MAEARYHVRFEDGASGEKLGLMLTESPQIGFTRRLVNPYAAKAGSGGTKDSDLTEWSLVSFRDWRGGRGQDDLVDAATFFDAVGLETRVEGQITLGPLPQQQEGTNPKYEPGSVASYVVGYPVAEQQTARPRPGNMRLGSDNISLKRGQRFLVQDTNGETARWIKSIDVRLAKVRATGPVRVSLYSDSSGFPGSELTYKEVAAASIGTSEAWVNFEFSSTYQVVAGTHYWIVVTVTLGNIYYLYGTRDLYADGYLGLYDESGWNTSPVWKGYDLNFRVRYERFTRSMSFTVQAGGVTCTSVQLYLAKAGHPGTFTASLHEDDDGDPAAAALTSKTFDGDSDVGATMGWVEVEWSSGQALTGEGVYHVVITPPADEVVAGGSLYWGGLSSGGYAGGASHRKVATGSWTAITPDLYFRLNTEALDGNVLAFALYNSKWYCAAGDTVYEWNGGTEEWDVSDQQGSKNVTAMVAWGDYLWVGRGADHVLRRYNGISWADVSATYAKLLKAGGGYLHRTNGAADHGHEVYYTADGSTWSSAIAIGTSAYEVTALEWYRDMLVCATAVRLWGLAADLAYPLLDWHSQEDSNNGVNMLAWSKTGCLYIPLRFGLYRWNGDTMAAVGPEQGMGLPATRAGRIAALCGTGNWLYAAVDASTTGYSSILSYSGRGGWHELQRSERTGQRVLALGFETLHSPSRLWYGMSDETRYLMLPDYSDNPYQWTGFEFNAGGELETSWVGGELIEVTKDLHELVVRGESLAGGQPVDIWYEVDRSGRWTYLGRVQDGPRQALRFRAPVFGSKTVGAGSTRTTIELATGSTSTDMEAGYWVRINGETRQVASITDSNTFVLETALSFPPAPGDAVYASTPAGREFRLRLVLSTNDKTLTPKVKAVVVRYQNNVLDRFVFQMQVQVADGLQDLVGNPYPQTAADLREELTKWAQRQTPFTLYDPDGVPYMVKVISMGEGGFARQEGTLLVRYKSVYSMNLVEVN